jgi:formate/nitrite transporter FocA (FNT family)
MRAQQRSARTESGKRSGMNQVQHPAEEKEEKQREARHRSSPSGKVVYKAILNEAEEELERANAALFWSGLAAGLSMGFSVVAESLLRAHLPEAPWRPLVAKLGYSVGFLIVILGRQQLFTENTLTPVLPLLRRKDAGTLVNVLRLWSVVLVANLLGALAIAYVLVRTNALEPHVRAAAIAIAHEATRHDWVLTLIKGVFAGWLIALVVWVLPYAEAARVWVIIILTYLVGLGGFSHIVAGAVEVFGLGWAGEKPWGPILGNYMLPTLIGNIIGGVTLVAALNHAQVAPGDDDEEL